MRLVLSVIYPVDVYLLPIFPKNVEGKIEKVERTVGTVVFDSAIVGTFKIAGNAIRLALLLGTSLRNVADSLLNPS